MPHIVFFDDISTLDWPQDLERSWNQHVDLAQEFGDCTTELVNDPTRIASILGRRVRRPNLVFIDMNWGVSDRDGLSLIGEARRAAPGLPILVFTETDWDSELITAVIQAGAQGYCHKNDTLAKLRTAVQKALESTDRKAEEIRQVQDKEERARLATEWILESVDKLPTATIRCAMEWIQDALAIRAPIARRRYSMALLSNGALAAIESLQTRNEATPSDELLRAAVLYQIGRLNEAEQAYLDLANGQDTPDLWDRLIYLARALQDQPKEHTYTLQKAQALQRCGQNQPAYALYEKLFRSDPANEGLQHGLLDVTRKLGRPVVPVLSEIIKSLHGRSDAEALHSSLGVLAPDEELAAALATLSVDHSWAAQAHFSWAADLFTSAETARARTAAHGLNLDGAFTPDQLIEIAGLYESLTLPDACHHALANASAKASGSLAEAGILARCQQQSLRVGDTQAARWYLIQLLNLKSQDGKYQEAAKLGSQWLEVHPKDLLLRESLADLLLQDEGHLKAAIGNYLELLSTDTIRRDPRDTGRLLVKLRSVREGQSDADRIQRAIQAEFTSRSQAFTLPSRDRTLRKEKIFFIGDEVLGHYKSEIDSIIQGVNGAHTKFYLFGKKSVDSSRV